MTEDQKAILAHVLIDPEAWFENVKEVFAEGADSVLANKIAKYEPAYREALAGGNYKTRAEREALSPA